MSELLYSTVACQRRRTKQDYREPQKIKTFHLRASHTTLTTPRCQKEKHVFGLGSKSNCLPCFEIKIVGSDVFIICTLTFKWEWDYDFLCVFHVYPRTFCIHVKYIFVKGAGLSEAYIPRDTQALRILELPYPV